jgi:hypothetical protein
VSDARADATRAKAVAMLVVERHRLEAAVVDQEAAIETCRLAGVHEKWLGPSLRKLELLRSQLAEVTPGRRAAGGGDA